MIKHNCHEFHILTKTKNSTKLSFMLLNYEIHEKQLISVRNHVSLHL